MYPTIEVRILTERDRTRLAEGINWKNVVKYLLTDKYSPKQAKDILVYFKDLVGSDTFADIMMLTPDSDRLYEKVSRELVRARRY